MAKEKGFVVKTGKSRSTQGWTGNVKGYPAMNERHANEIREIMIEKNGFDADDVYLEPVNAKYVED